MLSDITFGTQHVKQKIPGFGVEHNWIKRSIFWELPYWYTNLIRHNLDVMHVEKNMFKNIFNIVMDIKNKTKDNAKTRKDLERYYSRHHLYLKSYNDRLCKPKASYALTTEQKRNICIWLKEMKLPDGYASNISRCVDVDDCKFYGLKSHDCHKLMERLLPIAFRDMVPPSVWNAITELCHFF